MDLLLIGFGVAVFVYGVHRAARYAEAKGWIFYRTRPPRIRTVGLFEEVFEPSVQHRVVEEAAEAIRADHDESGQGTPFSAP